MAVSVHSERLGADVYLGKQPAQERRVGVKYEEDIRPALVKAGLVPQDPKVFGHGHTFAQGKWLMLGNGPISEGEGTLPASWTAAANGCGNCTIADCYHTLMLAEKVSGKPLSPVDARIAIEAYEARTLAANGGAYSPETGEGDTGLDIQAVVEWLVAEGCKDANGVAHTIPAHGVFTLQPGNVQHLREAAWLTEKVKVGLVLCQAQMEQFDASSQPTWDYVKGSPEVGGHDIPVVGWHGGLSWSEDVYWTEAFIENQNDESIAVLHPEQFRSDGEDYEGFTEGDVEKWAVEVATQKLEAP